MSILCFKVFWEVPGDRTKASAHDEKGDTSRGEPTPAEKELVLKDLLAVEKLSFSGSEKADRETLEYVFADEFINIDEEGVATGRVKWIDQATEDEEPGASISISGARLVSLTKDEATISLIKTYKKPGDKTSRTLDTDRFIKRDGRWQMNHSESTAIK